MKRLALLATAVLIGTAGLAQAETITEEVIIQKPAMSPLEAFDTMDLDNDWIVDTIEYDNAVNYSTHNLGAYSFEGMDLNGNGLITRTEAKRVTPEQAASSSTVIRTIVKDPVYVDVVEPAGGQMEVQSSTTTVVR